MKWNAHIEDMVTRANKKLWILRRLSFLGASQTDLLDIYTKQIRSILEYAVPAWHGSTSQADKCDIERVQKSACHIILGKKYIGYSNALTVLGLEPLEVRRIGLCLKFALKAEIHPKFQTWFKPAVQNRVLRPRNKKYVSVKSYSERFTSSPISYLTDLLNSHYSKL